MRDKDQHETVESVNPNATKAPGFMPRISTRDVFERLIEEELRCGRLTPGRRRRIVRYAARLGLSAVEAGRFADRCRDRALTSPDTVERFHALRLVTRPTIGAAQVGKVVIAAAVAVLLGFLLWGR